MTYHMERTLRLLGKTKNDTEVIEMDNMNGHAQVRFPEKLFEVISEKPSTFLQWSKDNKSVVVDEDEFEASVMDHYPGLVQITSFANFRRLFREYGFSWTFKDDKFVFTHDCFRKGRPDLLTGILTKRKAPSMKQVIRKAAKLSEQLSPEEKADVGRRLIYRSDSGVPRRSSTYSSPTQSPTRQTRGRGKGRGRGRPRGSGRHVRHTAAAHVTCGQEGGVTAEDQLEFDTASSRTDTDTDLPNHGDVMEKPGRTATTTPTPAPGPYPFTFPLIPSSQPCCPLWGTYCVPVCPNPAAHAFSWAAHSAGEAWGCPPDHNKPATQQGASKSVPDPPLKYYDDHQYQRHSKMESSEEKFLPRHQQQQQPWISATLGNLGMIPAAGDCGHPSMVSAQSGGHPPPLIPAPSTAEIKPLPQGGGAPGDNCTYYSL